MHRGLGGGRENRELRKHEQTADKISGGLFLKCVYCSPGQWGAEGPRRPGRGTAGRWQARQTWSRSLNRSCRECCGRGQACGCFLCRSPQGRPWTEFRTSGPREQNSEGAQDEKGSPSAYLTVANLTPPPSNLLAMCGRILCRGQENTDERNITPPIREYHPSKNQ